MNSPRRINKKIDNYYMKEIIELSKNINLYAVSLLVDYQDIFDDEEINRINIYINKIEQYIKLLEGYKTLVDAGKNNPNNSRKFKVIAQEIFEIEQLLRKYSIKVWSKGQTDINSFKNGDDYCFVVHSLLIDPNFKYKNDEDFLEKQYEERMNRLHDKKRRFLSCSLVKNNLTRLFNGSHLAVIVDVNDSNYIAANYRDAATADSAFTKTTVNPGNYDDIYTIKRDETGNIFTLENATIVSTPKIIQYWQLYDESAISVNEIILDRMKTKAKGILCYGYGNKFLSYSYKFADELEKKYRLPLVFIDKSLYDDKKLTEYDTDEQLEITNGIKQFLDEKTRNQIYKICGNDYNVAEETYIKIFELANKENITNSKDAKRIVNRLVEQFIEKNIIEREIEL